MFITFIFLSFYGKIISVKIMAEELENLTGAIEDITYKNEDNGYAVVEVSTDEGYVTVVGVLGNIIVIRASEDSLKPRAFSTPCLPMRLVCFAFYRAEL